MQYEDAYQYQNIMGPLVKLEADYDKHMGFADIVTGELSEPLDAAAQKRRREQLAKVKREDRDATSDDDDEVARPENNPGILENKRQIEEANAKKKARR